MFIQFPYSLSLLLVYTCCDCYTYIQSSYIFSQSLHGLSPFEMVYKKVPHYELLRTFGTQCFPCLRAYCQNKPLFLLHLLHLLIVIPWSPWPKQVSKSQKFIIQLAFCKLQNHGNFPLRFLNSKLQCRRNMMPWLTMALGNWCLYQLIKRPLVASGCLGQKY